MNKFSPLAVVVFLLAAPVCVRAAEVTNLRCEYRESPNGVDVAKPRLSWMMAAPGQATGGDPAARHEAPPRERLLFNDGWRFQKGDPAEVGASLTYDALKPWLLAGTAGIVAAAPKRPEGEAPGEKLEVVQPGFNDSAWRALNLPHDWGIEGPFQQNLSGSTAKLPWSGVGWYRKQFTVEAEKSPRNYYLEIDGAMSYAVVWCNGKFVGGWPYGYASWRLDLTPFIKPGADNTLAVHLDNPEDSSRWYPGGGIYRNVWLESTSPVHAERRGTFVTTPEVSAETATIRIETRIANRSSRPADVRVATRIFKLSAGGMAEGPELAISAEESLAMPAGEVRPATAQIKLAKPRLWDVVTPERYIAVTTVRQEGRIIDQLETPFGIRSARFTADDGFHLNGKRVPLRGVCLHHDLGSLGAAFNTRAAERQLEMLKEMGCNAIRTSHNPPAPEFLELCDRLGFLVICEFSDTWTVAKTSNGYATLFSDWSEADLRSMIRRDRNHPSVILWSTGNEIGEQTDSDNSLHPVSARLTAIAHEEDPTRSVTVGCDRPESGQNGFQKTVDVFGYNYKPHLYKTFRADNPKQALYGSETASAYSSRGEYLFPPDASQNDGTMGCHMSSYDVYASGNGYRPEVEFKGQDENPFVAGEFVWTGFDYLGEPTPFYDANAPSRSSYYGIIDLAGFKKDRFYLYQARWRPELPMAHILPHWNWPERVGQVTPVHVYTSGDEAELFLNGQSLGRRKKGAFEYRLCWDEVKFTPGELKVVAYKDGKEWATSTVKTTGEAARLRLEADRPAISADGRDLAFLTATVADKDGQQVPRAMQKVRFEIAGPGEIVATDNGDPSDHTSFQSPERRAFNGLALAIVRAKAGQPGPITVRVNCEGLAPAEVTLNAFPPGQSPGRSQAGSTEQSPVSSDPPSPRLRRTGQSSDVSIQRGVRQTAYQVLVASSPELLAKDQGDLWDSGKVESDQSIQVEYQGKPLESRTRCWWKVRVWSSSSLTSDSCLLTPSSWSQPASWTMGLLKPEDWSAKWIGLPPAAAATDLDGVVVKRATYRTLDGAVAVDVTPILRNALEAKKFPFLVDGNNLGGDPAPGVVKELVVDYTCRGQTGVSRAQDFSELNIPGGPVGTPAPWFRGECELGAKPESAVVTVHSHAYFELYINGVKAGDDVLTPAVSHPQAQTFTVAYDVGHLLKPGKNCLGLWMGKGWADPIAVRAQLDAVVQGQKVSFGTGPEWKTRPSGYSHIGSWGWNNFGGERLDAAAHVPDWCQPGLDTASWMNAVEASGPQGPALNQAVPLNRIGVRMVAKEIIPLADGRYEIDFGTNLTGWLRLKFPPLQAGQVVRMYFADRVFPGSVQASPIGNITISQISCTAFPRNGGGDNLYQTYNQVSEFVSAGVPGEEFCHKFNYAGFRHVVVEGLNAAPRKEDATALLVETALPDAGAFECSDPLINRIHQANRWTLRCLNLGGYMVDCPHRERMGYGDGQVSLEGMMMNFDASSFYEKWGRDWRLAQNPGDGTMPNIAPPLCAGGGGPPWAGVIAALPWDHYLHYGDRRILEENISAGRRYVEFLDSRADHDIMRAWGEGLDFLGDWVPPRRGMDTQNWPTRDMAELFCNCYRIYLWQLVENMAVALGRTDEAGHARKRMASIRTAVHASYYDAVNKRYVIDEQIYYAMPLLTGVTPEGERAAVMANLVKCIEQKNKGHLDTGMLGTKFLLRFLADVGRDDLVLKMYQKKDYPGWGYMVEQGATTLWEQWNGYWSQIHSCFASADTWFYQGLAGIRPDPAAPGFKHIIIRPAIVGDPPSQGSSGAAGLAWVKSHHDSPYGRIVSHWRRAPSTSPRAGANLTMEVTIPPNTTATVYVPALSAVEGPAKDAAGVVESGKPAAKADGVKFLRMEGSAAVFEVGSGNYSFCILK